MRCFNRPDLLPMKTRCCAFSLAGFLICTAFLPASGAAALSGAFTPMPAGTNINLTAEGKLDWVHWGLGSAWTTERKYGVAQQLTNAFLAPWDKYFNFYDGPFQFTSGADMFTWSDGAPVQIVTNTPAGVCIYGDKFSGSNPTGF